MQDEIEGGLRHDVILEEAVDGCWQEDMLLKRSSPVFGENQPGSLSNIIQLRSRCQSKALFLWFLVLWNSRQYFCVFYIMGVEHLDSAMLGTALALALDLFIPSRICNLFDQHTTIEE